ncbi:MAG: ABC transporter substrate-binding protein, partial [Cyanobacteria bacterium RM1_2_2]|nr:ABC transporter substrate-binding protein [Cyanobacteria bacterium RM1_2_2]
RDLPPVSLLPQPLHLSLISPLWHGVNPPPNREVLQRLVDRFNQNHPAIQVESLYVGQGDQQIPKILAAVVGNVPPNLLWYAPTLTGQLVELEAIAPVEGWLDASIKAQIDPALFSSMQLEGHLWSVPFSVNNVGIFYRPRLFEAAGITQLPQTWDELRQVARQLTRPEAGQHGLLLPLGKGEWTVFMWLPFMWSAGGHWQASQQLPESNINLVNAGAIEALQFWRDLIRDGSAILSQPERGYELDQFVSGKVAMQLTGPWTLGQLQATNVDYAVMPIPVQQQPATSIGGENLFIFKTTPEQEQAAQVFAKYVLSEAFQTEWALSTGYLPVNLKARQNADYQQFLADQPAVQVFLDQASYGKSRPIFPGYSRLSDTMGRAIEAVLLGKDAPETALQKAQKRLDLMLN